MLALRAAACVPIHCNPFSGKVHAGITQCYADQPP